MACHWLTALCWASTFLALVAVDPCVCQDLVVKGSVTFLDDDFNAVAAEARDEYKRRTLVCSITVSGPYKNKITGKVKYAWHYKTRASPILGRNPRLVVIPTSSADTGDYICRVTHKYRLSNTVVKRVSTEFSTYLKVLDTIQEYFCYIRPVFTNPIIPPRSCSTKNVTTTIYRRPGERFRIDCGAVSKFPYISYFVITNTFEKETQPVYDITSVGVGDAGDWICVATNPVIENRHIFHLVVDTSTTSTTRTPPTTTIKPTTRRLPETRSSKTSPMVTSSTPTATESPHKPTTSVLFTSDGSNGNAQNNADGQADAEQSELPPQAHSSNTLVITLATSVCSVLVMIFLAAGVIWWRQKDSEIPVKPKHAYNSCDTTSEALSNPNPPVMMMTTDINNDHMLHAPQIKRTRQDSGTNSIPSIESDI